MSLEGLRVAVTRAPEQAQELCRLLAAERAHVVALPLIRVVGAAEPEPLIAAVRDGHYDWVVFTSANAVRFTAAALTGGHVPEPGDSARGAASRSPEAATSSAAGTGTSLLAGALAGARIACVGPATARAANAAGLRVDVIPDAGVGAALSAAMGAAALQNTRVLWPRAQGATPTLIATLDAAGARVTAPVAYRSVADRGAAQALADIVLQGGVDVVTFTSPSCVRSLAAALPVLEGVTVAVIGPVTAEAARAVGYNVDVVAEEHSVAGLVAGLRGYMG